MTSERSPRRRQITMIIDFNEIIIVLMHQHLISDNSKFIEGETFVESRVLYNI